MYYRLLLSILLMPALSYTAQAQRTIALEFPAAYFWDGMEPLTFENPFTPARVFNRAGQSLSYTHQQDGLGLRFGLDHFYKQYQKGSEWSNIPAYAAFIREYYNLHVDVVGKLFKSAYVHVDGLIGPTIKLISEDSMILPKPMLPGANTETTDNFMQFGANAGILVTIPITPRFSFRVLAQHTTMFFTRHQKQVSGGSLGIGYSFGEKFRAQRQQAPENQ